MAAATTEIEREPRRRTVEMKGFSRNVVQPIDGPDAIYHDIDNGIAICPLPLGRHEVALLAST